MSARCGCGACTPPSGCPSGTTMRDGQSSSVANPIPSEVATRYLGGSSYMVSASSRLGPGIGAAKLREERRMVEQQFGIQILPTWHGEPAGNPEQFTHDVRVELHRILHSRAGRVLADCLRFQFSSRAPGHGDGRGKVVLVMPYEGNDCNAEEDGVTPGSQQSVVLFTPATGASGCSKGKPATLPHQILVHELVHALRRVSGHLHAHRVRNKL